MSELNLLATGIIMGVTDQPEGLAQYGVMGVALGALGWFTVWGEKRRDARDKDNREFMESQHKDLVEALHRSEARYHELVLSKKKED